MKVKQILNTPLIAPTAEDIISWKYTMDDNYTIRSGYNAQIEWAISSSQQSQTSSNYLEGAHIWNKLWQIEAPPKQIYLLRRILHNVIPVTTNLLTKDWYGSALP
ncbi:hypothetical protein TSUD_385050 [Trifolium subterraneum]|uniref:Reverse transcriptase zinc-binding domain-containing protein n=1 Tax=Trifolium subterraneum TaxID=3900 RepID=A0A2Z6MC92_TRISU|nr:hypothetical protein TSUD_385050 [Trifolium subterraneum]